MRDHKLDIIKDVDGKSLKKNKSKRKGFGYQILGFGSGGGATVFTTNFLVIAGGGGAGGGGAGGGGAGGYRASGFGPCSLRATALELEPGCYTITIGAGGTGAPGPAYSAGATNGGSSILGACGVEGCNMITASGGGRSGGQSGGGADGGSGGGGGLFSSGGTNGGKGLGNTGSFDPSEGNNGGTSTAAHVNGNGGGGGGAGSVGLPGPANSGTGGNGVPNNIGACGTPFSRVNFAGGGASSGGSRCSPSGAGATNSNGTANSGGGGGGGTGLGCGGNGGAGVVIVRAPAKASLSVTPGGATATHPGGDKIATFTASGTLTIA